MKKHIRLTDDLSATKADTVKMVCDCGWAEKAFVQDAIPRAAAHMRDRHNGGVVHYKNLTREIRQNGTVGPVITGKINKGNKGLLL